MINLTDLEKAFDKIQHMIKKKKTFNKLGIEGSYLNIMKFMYNITLSGEKLKTFSPRQACSPWTPLLNIVLEFLARAIS